MRMLPARTLNKRRIHSEIERSLEGANTWWIIAGHGRQGDQRGEQWRRREWDGWVCSWYVVVVILNSVVVNTGGYYILLLSLQICASTLLIVSHPIITIRGYKVQLQNVQNAVPAPFCPPFVSPKFKATEYFLSTD